MMNNKVFRKKSLDRISSPEQLNDYIRVTNPSVWMMMGAVILLLAGIFVWGIFGRLDTTLTVGAITQGDETICYVREADIDSVSEDMVVLIGEDAYPIRQIAPQPVQVDESFAEYLNHLGGYATGEWVYALELEGSYGEDGSIFDAEILIERIAPMTFILN